MEMDDYTPPEVGSEKTESEDSDLESEAGSSDQADEEHRTLHEQENSQPKPTPPEIPPEWERMRADNPHDRRHEVCGPSSAQMQNHVGECPPTDSSNGRRPKSTTQPRAWPQPRNSDFGNTPPEGTSGPASGSENTISNPRADIVPYPIASKGRGDGNIG